VALDLEWKSPCRCLPWWLRRYVCLFSIFKSYLEVYLFAAKVYAAIAEFLTTESAKPDFSASVYTDAYLRHITTLNDIKDRNRRAYHALMATLFNECW
jgi:hypothetical protein